MSNANEELQTIRSTMELNIKRAVTPMLILRMIAASDTTIAEAQEAITKASNGMVVIENLYSSVYRFLGRGYIEKAGFRDLHHIGRHSDLFRITEKGLEALLEYEKIYEKYICVVSNITMS